MVQGRASVAVTGVRRGLVEDYYAALNWTSARDIRKILRAYEHILNALDSAIEHPTPSPFGGTNEEASKRRREDLVGQLKRDGYNYDNKRLVPSGEVDLRGLHEASDVVDVTTLRDHIRRIEDSVETDPAQDANPRGFVRSIREECLDRLIVLGERRLLRALDEFVAHYHAKRNHQGLGNDLIAPERRPLAGAHVRCRERLGGLLRYYHRAA